jgi:hypothetical protein
MVLDTDRLPVSRAKIHQALLAEGVTGLGAAYQNVHLQPIYQKRIAYGSRGFPWTGGLYQGNVRYEKGICPVAERLHDEQYLGLFMCMHEYNDEQVDLVIAAFRKVWDHLETLRG